MNRILKDWEITIKYAKAFEDSVRRLTKSETERKYV